MSTAYDNAAFAQDFGVTSLTTPAFAIGSGADRGAIVSLDGVGGDPGAVTAVSVGGVAGAAIPGASGNNGANWISLFKVIAPPAGMQTASVTWTTPRSASVGVITADGVDQTVGVNGGNYAQAFANNVSIDIASNAGDLTVTCNANDAALTTQTSNQTKRIAAFGSMDTGPGTAGPITHTWTQSGTFLNNVAGANFIQAAPAGGTVVNPLSGRGGAAAQPLA